MENKVGSVRNPLTVISIFAGIAEISGTAVLPHIASENQALYIWFLMFFPFALISLFFATLNFNHRVLYAPSDFKDEDNFVNILKKSSFSEIIEFKETEKAQIEEEFSSEVISVEENISNYSGSASTTKERNSREREPSVDPDQLIFEADELLSKETMFSSKEQRNRIELLTKKISQQRFHEIRIAERLALEKIEFELGVNIERDMKMEVGNSISHFDGVIRQGAKLTAIEVKYFRTSRSSPLSMGGWQSLRYRLDALYQSLNEEQRKDFSFVLVVVNDSEPAEVERLINKRLSGLQFPIAIKIFDFDELVSEKYKSV